MRRRYNLEFLGIEQAIKERDLETRLIDNLQRFLLELGYGFCFIGRQYRLALATKEYFVDLLFYHRFLKALVAFDLKIGEFEPEHAGKMDFYLNLLNDQQRCPDDGPSIGIILCAEKNDVEVEYALKSKTNPIGVAQYELQSKLPSELEGKLPTAEQLASVVRRSLPSTPNARTHGRKWRTAMTDQRDSIAQSIRSLCVKSLRNPAIEFLRTFGYESDRMINLGSSNPETFLAFVNQSSAAGVINKSRAHRPPDLRKRASGRVAQQRALERLVAQPVKRQ